ncbi:hypothetical protein J7K07_03935 [Candidatus Bathyarchaeota archaeon]|nr:hypothetical protein [Candidatus Bathyarchaeota archaeon]
MKHRVLVVILGVDGSGAGRGFYKRGRMHIAVFGFPGTGKSTFLLNLIKRSGRHCQKDRRD